LHMHACFSDALCIDGLRPPKAPTQVTCAHCQRSRCGAEPSGPAAANISFNRARYLTSLFVSVNTQIRSFFHRTQTPTQGFLPLPAASTLPSQRRGANHTEPCREWEGVRAKFFRSSCKEPERGRRAALAHRKLARARAGEPRRSDRSHGTPQRPVLASRRSQGPR
jgi:hypothetical protein